MNTPAKQLILLAALIFLANFAFAQSMQYTDAWSSNGGSTADGIVWGGYSLKANATSVPAESDCLCWDWNDNGSSDETQSNWDHCFCSSGTKQTQCSAYSTWVNSLCSSGLCNVQSLGADHFIDTGSSGNRWKSNIDIREYRDCDNSSGQQGIWNWLGTPGIPYYVVSPKQYNCNDVSSQYYDTQATFQTGLNVVINNSNYCGTYYACDESDSHTNHDDVLINSATGSIPFPCSIIDGNASSTQICSSGAACLSGVCGGARTEHVSVCVSDGSVGLGVNTKTFDKTCGGAGFQISSNGFSDSCTNYLGAGFVCDADLDNQTYTTGINASQFCKKDVYQSCTSSPQCWNDNGNIDCMGSASKICTTGNNGSTCFNNDNLQCDSGRCDTTCQSKLPDGSSCDEPSDCIANACTAGVCGQGQGPGTACALDSQCASNFCVANICSATHSPKVVRTDTWTQANSNGISDENDGHVFVNQSVYPNVTGLREETDMVCYDFDGNGVYDACYFDNNGCGGGGCTANSCNYFPIPQNVQNKYSCDIDSPTGCRIGLDGGTQAKICSGANCAVNTSQGSNYRQIIAKSYTDCDNTANLRAEVSPTAGVNGDYYYVYHSKYYKAEDTSLNQQNYFETGQWGYSDTNSNEYILHQCTGNTAVDVVAEESRVTTPNGVIPNVCKKVPGQSCSSNSECLYNVCSGNPGTCQLSGGIKGHLIDETGHPIAGKVMKLTTCNNTLVAQSTTDASGKYSFYAPAGSYKQKTTAPWGEVTFVWAGEPSGCHSFGTGFNIVWSQLYTRANIHGRALDPLGNPSTNLPFEAATCQNVVLDTDNTDFQGYFDLSTDTGYQKINVNLNGNKFPITTENGNACLFQYGEVDLGNIEVTANCSLYDNTCSDINPDVRLYNCQSSSANGCSCTTQICAAGCTEGASACNVVGTGTIKVTVMDVNGSPVPYAEIRSNGASVGKTNGWGKKDINVQHGSYSIKATCPNDPISQTKNIYTNTNQKYISYVLNCPTPPKGDLKVIVNDVNGLPIVNAHIFIDESQSTAAITDIFGLAKVSNVPYGQHSMQFVYFLDFNGVALQTNRVIDINSTQTTVVQTLSSPNQSGSSTSITQVNPSDLGIFSGTIAVGTVFLAAVSARGDYCACVDHYSDVPIFDECMNAWGPNNTTTDLTHEISPFRNFVSDHYNEHLYCESHFMGTIKKVGEFAAIDHGIGLAFGGLGVSYRVVEKIVPVSKTISEAVTLASEIKLVKNFITKVKYTKSDIDIIFDDLLNSPIKPYTIRGINGLTFEGKLAMESVIHKMGVNGDEYIAQAVQSGFSKEYIADVFNGLGKLKNDPRVSQQVRNSLDDMLAHDLRYGNLGNKEGALAEVWGGAYSDDFLNAGLLEHNTVPAGVPANGRKSDYILGNNEIVEIKSTNMETVSYDTFLQKIDDTIKKAQQWQAADPNRLIHVKYTTHFTNEQVKLDIYLTMVNNISSTGAAVDISKVILHWS